MRVTRLLWESDAPSRFRGYLPVSVRARLGALLALIVALLTIGSPANAEPPVDFGGATISDTAGVLGSRSADVRTALANLQQQSGVTLLVAFVKTISSPSDITAWRTEVVSRNRLGSNNALLIVAVSDRVYDFSLDNTLGLSGSARSTIERTNIVPALAKDQWADAAIGAANGLAGALAGSGSGAGGTAPVPASGGFNWLPTVLILGAFLIAVLLAVRALRRRRPAGTALPSGQVSQKDLDLRAGTLLVQLDDAVKTSEQELSFAMAEFGEAQTAPYRTALDSAKGKVAEAFRLKQLLDDARPETDQEKRTMTEQIISLCQLAEDELEAQAEGFGQLRDLAADIPGALGRITTEAESVQSRIRAAEETLTALRASFDEPALDTVAENPEQAKKLLQLAANSGSAAAEQVRAGKNGEAAVAVRAAQQSLAQAAQLLAAVDRAAVDLPAAVDKLQIAAAEVGQDIAEARGLSDAARATVPAQLSVLLTEAERGLAQARAGGAGRRDPVTAVAVLNELNGRLDAALAPAREQAVSVQRARATLDRTLATARSQVAAANDFIATRRGGIGQGARTRIAEAQRYLAQAEALGASDPVAALADAQAANSMAASALNYAKSDVGDFWASNSPSYSGSRRGGIDVTSAVLGGILGGVIFGGGHSGSGHSGGGHFGGGGFGGGGGSFGGGGGFSGGGGRF